MEIVLAIMVIGLGAFCFFLYTQITTLRFENSIIKQNLKSIEEFINGDLHEEYEKLIGVLEDVKVRLDTLSGEIKGPIGGSAVSGLGPLEGLLGNPNVRVSVQGPGGQEGFLKMLSDLMNGTVTPAISAEEDPSMVASEEEQENLLCSALENLLQGMQAHKFSSVEENLDKLVHRMQSWVNHWRQRVDLNVLKNENEGPGKHYATLIKYGRKLVEVEDLLKTGKDESRSEAYFTFEEIKNELSHH